MLLFDCIKCTIENNILYMAKRGEGLKSLPYEVNTNISDEDIKIFTVRELVSIIDISRINEGYAKDIMGDIYDVNLIKSKKMKNL